MKRMATPGSTEEEVPNKKMQEMAPVWVLY
jgi:hypothetical protein